MIVRRCDERKYKTVVGEFYEHLDIISRHKQPDEYVFCVTVVLTDGREAHSKQTASQFHMELTNIPHNIIYKQLTDELWHFLRKPI